MEKKNEKLSLFNLLTMNLGLALGSGVFTLFTAVIGFAGRSICFAVLIGTAMGLFMSFPAAFLASTIKLTGGEYTRGLALLPVGLAGVNGVIKQVSAFGYSAYIFGMANYTLQLIPGVSASYKAIAFAYLVLFFLLGVKGAKSAAKIQNIMVILLLLALGVYIFGGLPAIQPDYFRREGFFAGGASGFMYATAMLAMGASGGAGIVGFASVAKNPRKNIPLALILGAALVAVIYFLVALVSAGIVPVETVQGKNLGIVARTFLTKPLYIFFMIGGALFALGSSINGFLATLQFPWRKMADDGWIPKFLLKCDKKYDYPYILMGMFFVVGGILPIVFDLNIATVSSFASFPNFAFNAVLALATLRLPKKYPQLWARSPFHMPKPFFVLFILLAFASGAFVTVNFIWNLNQTMVIGMCAALAIISAYILWRYRAGYVHVEHILSELRDIPDGEEPTA